MKRIGELVERIFVVAVFCCLSGGFTRLGYGLPLPTPTILYGLTWLLLAITVSLIVARFAAASAVLADLWPNLLIVAVAMLSLCWSVAPDRTWRSVLGLAAPSAFAIYVAVSFSVLEQLDLLQKALFLVAAGALVDVLSIDLAAWQPLGMTGWFTDKNHLGRCMALAVLASFVAGSVPSRRFTAILGGWLCLMVLIASNSRSAMIVASVCVGGFFLSCLAQRFPAWAWRMLGLATALALGIVAVVVRHGDVVFAWMGRDSTLSMRTIIWRVLVEKWAQRPWLGYGYGAFWSQENSPGAEIAATLNFYPWHAHNGYLDLGLELGAIGVTLFVIVLLTYSRQAVQVGMRSSVTWALWPATYIGFFVLSNVTESDLVHPDSIYWVAYLMAAAQVGQIVREPAQAKGLDRPSL